MVKEKLLKYFQITFAVSMLLIFGIALSKPLNNLVPQRMLFYTLFWVVLLCGLWYLMCFLEVKVLGLEEKMKLFLPIFLLVYGVALYIISCLLRSEPLTDYLNVYDAALHFARGEEVTNWEYFARWYNNVGGMLALSLLFFIVGWLPDGVDPYYFVLFMNVVQVVMVIACLYYLSGKGMHKHSIAAKGMILILSVLWIPIWSNTSVFYADQLSFGMGVFGVTLLVKGWKADRWPVYYGAAGAVFALGVQLKVTTATILIALTIVIFLLFNLQRYKKRIAIMAMFFTLLLAGCSLYSRTLPCQEESERLKAPIEYWFALGIVGNGTYAANEEFATRCLTAPTMKERKAVAREQIAGQIGNLVDLDHIVAKVRQNFGCGEMGASGYLVYRDDENLLWNWVSAEGKYYWKYACLSTSFFFAALLLLGMGSMVQFFHKENIRKEAALFLSAELAFWGLCLFMMLWEAQDKLMYNHSGWLMLALVYNLEWLGEKAHNGLLYFKGKKGRK